MVTWYHDVPHPCVRTVARVEWGCGGYGGAHRHVIAQVSLAGMVYWRHMQRCIRQYHPFLPSTLPNTLPHLGGEEALGVVRSVLLAKTHSMARSSELKASCAT